MKYMYMPVAKFYIYMAWMSLYVYASKREIGPCPYVLGILLYAKNIEQQKINYFLTKIEL
jgi:hypothetical protein